MVTVQRSFSAVTNRHDGQWPLTGRYYMRCWAIELLVAATVFLTYPYRSMSIRKSEARQLKDEGSSVWIWVLRNETITHTNRLITTNTYQSYHISLLNPIYSFIYIFLSFENCTWTVWKKIYENFKLSRVQLPKSSLIFIPELKNRNNIFNVLQMQHFLSFLKKKRLI